MNLITEKQKEKIDSIIYELNIDYNECREITDKIVNIIENKDGKKECEICGAWIDIHTTRCPYCAEDLI